MIKAVVTDIEGTTSSLSFVKDILFPYARRELPSFLTTHGREPAVQGLLDDARAVAGQPLADDALVAALLRWIDEDRKVTPLKALQGMIWEEGYRRGDFTGHVYEDAARQLRRWHDAGLRLYVFSSGSVQAQQLLFRHTPFGDLTPLFSGYFDTRIGHKREQPAYAHIATHLGLAPAEILFLSDIEEELDAARAVGMQTVCLVREGGAGASGHRQAKSFDEIAPADDGA